MAPKIGMIMSPTSDSTIRPKAAPMITPMARSTTLPLTANSRNSSRTFIFCSSWAVPGPLTIGQAGPIPKGWVGSGGSHGPRFVMFCGWGAGETLKEGPGDVAASLDRDRDRAGLYRPAVRRGELRRPALACRTRGPLAADDLSALPCD